MPLIQWELSHCDFGGSAFVLEKIWEDFPEAQLLGLQPHVPGILVPLLTESQPEVPCFIFSTGGLFLHMGNKLVWMLCSDTWQFQLLSVRVVVEP
jgi:hypothetical protein